MEIVIAILIVLLAGFILFKNLRSSSKGKCSSCDGCKKKCDKKPLK